MTKFVGPQYICYEMRAHSDKFCYFIVGPDDHVHSLLLYGFELCTANMWVVGTVTKQNRSAM
jgi:hypothetical protein